LPLDSISEINDDTINGTIIIMIEYEVIENNFEPNVFVEEDISEPINEFERNDFLLYGAYPTVFLFGTGIPGNKSIPLAFSRKKATPF
jgi:hypothetical protein